MQEQAAFQLGERPAVYEGDAALPLGVILALCVLGLKWSGVGLAIPE